MTGVFFTVDDLLTEYYVNMPSVYFMDDKFARLQWILRRSGSEYFID